MQIKKPIFWDFKKPTLLANLLKFFSFGINLNNKRIFKKIRINGIKTICVGNIYIGGTGKTPTCVSIAQILKDQGKKTTFVKKYYKNQKDEQILLKKYGNLICKIKRIDAIEIAKSKKFEFAVCDDGLQDKKIDYDLKIVCFNSEVFIGNGLVIPAGPLREKLENLKHYQIAIINGNIDNIKKFKVYLKKFNKNIKIFSGKYVISENIKKYQNKKYIAFSGIGNHSTFLNTLKKNKIKIIRNFHFADHYNYKDKDIEKIKEEAKLYNSRIITTEKDILRLSKKNSKNIDFIKIKIELKDKLKLTNYLKNI